MNKAKNLWQLPILKGVAGGAIFMIVALVLVTFILPAWAVTFPVGGYVIDLGELAPWIAIVITLGIWWEARHAKQKAAEAAASAGAAHADIKAVSVQIDGLLADRDKAKRAEGELVGEKKGVEAAQNLAEGQRQGREMERDSAKVQAAATAVLSATAGAPLPVEDERAAEIGERVAKATEKAADAQESIADAAKESKNK